MIKGKTIMCDECSTIAQLKDNNFHEIFDDDICRGCIDSVLARLTTDNHKTRGDK